MICPNPHSAKSYQLKLWGTDTRIQLNIDNLLDEQFVRFVSYGNVTNSAASGFPAGYYPLQYSVNMPRMFRLSVTSNF